MHPVDAFIRQAWASHQLSGSRPASKSALLRRVSLDLTGLVPTPAEVEAFEADSRDDAFERVVDRLLASPRYGERWARHWLDLARYAESEGFKADETRPNAWRYRDYVIRALNADKPYNRFIQEQLAGDELWPADPDAVVATAFNRHYPDESNARNLMQRRQEILNDITDTVGSVFLGLTLSCARCHDHKTDPVLQSDYYRLQAFFANTAAADATPLISGKALTEYQARLSTWEQKTASIRLELEAVEAPMRREILDDYIEKYPEPVQAALRKSDTERSPFECQMVAKAKLYIDPSSHQYLAPSRTVGSRLKGDAKKRWDALNSRLQEFAGLHPGPLPLATGIVDLGNQAPPTHVLKRGNWELPDAEVPPGQPIVLGRKLTAPPAGIKAASTGRRAQLARDLTRPDHPLTARVMMNRLWHYHFGTGLAATPSDLGLKGEAPTHPELLDWLASEFMDRGWSLKTMHRLIVTSETYRQSSDFNPASAQLDPANRWLWRFPRSRLEGEAIRDNMLLVSGRLNDRMAGPSVFPELPPGMESRGGWKPSSDLAERDRRSVYVFVRRNTRFPLFETFDMPDTHETCARRNQTTSPLQALALLNSNQSLDWARSMAARVISESGSDSKARIDRAYRLALGRGPDSAESVSASDFLHQQTALLLREVETSPKGGVADPASAARAAFEDFCHALLNSNEFVYRF